MNDSGYTTVPLPWTMVYASSVGSYQSADGVYYGSSWSDISTYTDGKTLVRLVWLAKNASTSTLNVARVGGSIKGIKKS